MPKKTHFDRLYERNGISRTERDNGNAMLAQKQASKEAAAQELAAQAIAKAAAKALPQ